MTFNGIRTVFLVNWTQTTCRGATKVKTTTISGAKKLHHVAPKRRSFLNRVLFLTLLLIGTGFPTGSLHNCNLLLQCHSNSTGQYTLARHRLLNWPPNRIVRLRCRAYCGSSTHSTRKTYGTSILFSNWRRHYEPTNAYHVRDDACAQRIGSSIKGNGERLHIRNRTDWICNR